LTGQKYNGKPFYRHQRGKDGCSQQWASATDIERAMIDAVIEIARHPTMMADIRTALKTLDRPTRDTQQIERAKKLRSKLDRIEDIYIDGDIERDSYLTKRGRILSQLAQIDLQKPAQSDISQLVDDISASIHLIAQASPRTQRELLTTLFTTLAIKDQEIKKAVPEPWAQPFFNLCEKWAGWGSATNNTRPILLNWLEIDA
jgi:hypothetical protein